MDSLQGQFLVASPQLSDENFFRSVVLMIQHDEDGAFGVILNRPTESTVESIWEMFQEESCCCERPIYMGGPVAGPLLAVHGEPQWSETDVMPGVYVATQRDLLNELVRQESAPFRLFTGYAGWAGGQLENELEVGGWLTAPATPEDIFADDDELWKRVSRSIGMDILAPAIRRHRVPDDPSMN